MRSDRVNLAILARCKVSGESYQFVSRAVAAGFLPATPEPPTRSQARLESAVFLALTRRADYAKSPLGLRRYLHGGRTSAPVAEVDALTQTPSQTITGCSRVVAAVLPYSLVPGGPSEFGVPQLEIRSVDSGDLLVSLRDLPDSLLRIRAGTDPDWHQAIEARNQQIRRSGGLPSWHGFHALRGQPDVDPHLYPELDWLGSFLLRTCAAVRLTPAYAANAWADRRELKVDLLLCNSAVDPGHETLLRHLVQAAPGLTFEVDCRCGAPSRGMCVAYLRHHTHSKTALIQLRFTPFDVHDVSEMRDRFRALGMSEKRLDKALPLNA